MPNTMMTEHGPVTTTYFCGGLAGNCAFQAGHRGSCLVDPCDADSDEEMARDAADADREERLADAAMVAAEATVRLCDACGKHAAQRRYSWPPQSAYNTETPREEFFFCGTSCFDFYAYAEYFPDLTPNTTRWPRA